MSLANAHHAQVVSSGCLIFQNGLTSFKKKGSHDETIIAGQGHLISHQFLELERRLVSFVTGHTSNSAPT